MVLLISLAPRQQHHSLVMAEFICDINHQPLHTCMACHSSDCYNSQHNDAYSRHKFAHKSTHIRNCCTSFQLVPQLFTAAIYCHFASHAWHMHDSTHTKHWHVQHACSTWVSFNYMHQYQKRTYRKRILLQRNSAVQLFESHVYIYKQDKKRKC